MRAWSCHALERGAASPYIRVEARVARKPASQRAPEHKQRRTRSGRHGLAPVPGLDPTDAASR